MRGGGNMMKKIIGILVCMLFLFSTLPVVASNAFDKNSENSYLKLNNNPTPINFNLLYGKIINPRFEVAVSGEKGYYFTAIDVKSIYIGWDSEDGFKSEIEYLTSGQFYIELKVLLFHGFMTKNYIFCCGFNLNDVD